jgi:hypothetical protein
MKALSLSILMFGLTTVGNAYAADPPFSFLPENPDEAKKVYESWQPKPETLALLEKHKLPRFLELKPAGDCAADGPELAVREVFDSWLIQCATGRSGASEVALG